MSNQNIKTNPTFIKAYLKTKQPNSYTEIAKDFNTSPAEIVKIFNQLNISFQPKNRIDKNTYKTYVNENPKVSRLEFAQKFNIAYDQVIDLENQTGVLCYRIDNKEYEPELIQKIKTTIQHQAEQFINPTITSISQETHYSHTLIKKILLYENIKLPVVFTKQTIEQYRRKHPDATESEIAHHFRKSTAAIQRLYKKEELRKAQTQRIAFVNTLLHPKFTKEHYNIYNARNNFTQYYPMIKQAASIYFHNKDNPVNITYIQPEDFALLAYAIYIKQTENPRLEIILAAKPDNTNFAYDNIIKWSQLGLLTIET